MYFSIAPNPEIKAHHLEREASDPESLCIIVITIIIIITSTIICIHMYLSLSLYIYIYITFHYYINYTANKRSAT